MSQKKESFTRIITNRGTAKEHLEYLIDGKDVDHETWHKKKNKAIKENRAKLIFDEDDHIQYDIYESQRMKLYIDHIEIFIDRKVKTKGYQCPNCKFVIITQIPNHAMVSSKGYWDSMSTCPSCDHDHFRCVYPSGRIKVNSATIKVVPETNI